MRTDTSRRSLAMGFFSAILVLWGGTALADDSIPATKLVYATQATPASTIVKTDRWFMEEVTRRSGGKITFEVYTSGALLPAQDLFPGLARGAVDIVTSVPAAYNPNDYPLSNVILPYITDKVDAATRAFGELYETTPSLKREYEGKGISMLWTYAGVESTLWTYKPVRTAADLQGMRIRAVQGIGEAFSILGATPVPMSPTEGVEAFKRRAIDGLSSMPFDSSVGLGLHKIGDYVSDGGGMGVYATWITAVNTRKFASLNPKAQAIIREVAREVPDYYLKQINQIIAAHSETLIKEGGKLVAILTPDAEKAVWREKVASKLQEKWLATTAAKGLNGREVLDNYVALVRKHEATSTYKTGVELYFSKAAR